MHLPFHSIPILMFLVFSLLFISLLLHFSIIPLATLYCQLLPSWNNISCKFWFKGTVEKTIFLLFILFVFAFSLTAHHFTPFQPSQPSQQPFHSIRPFASHPISTSHHRNGRPLTLQTQRIRTTTTTRNVELRLLRRLNWLPLP